MPPYSVEGLYSSLDPERHEIRLLVLRPGSDNSPLSGTLQQFQLPDDSNGKKGSAPFETISYVWGEPGVRDKILLNNQPLHIPASAASALRCMRLREGGRSLWIDSICINQADLQERGQQVSMMAGIYSFASTNLVYLGDDDGKAESAFNSVERIVQEIEDVTSGVSLRDFVFHDNRVIKRSTSPLACKPDIRALTWLFDRPWFRFEPPQAKITQRTDIKRVAVSGSSRSNFFQTAA